MLFSQLELVFAFPFNPETEFLMAAFILADVDVSDMEKYRESGYLENTPKIAARFGGKYRARGGEMHRLEGCLLYTSPSPRDLSTSRMPSSA